MCATGPVAADLSGARSLFAWSPDGLTQLAELVDVAVEVLRHALDGRDGPLPAGGPTAVAARHRSESLLPEVGGDPLVVLKGFTELAASWAVDLSHPAAVARMQAPAIVAAAAAELVAAVLNQGLQAWESGPAAIELERRLLQELCGLVGYPDSALGTLTSGGSASNLMALLLARDRAVRARSGADTMAAGWTGSLRPLVLCGPSAHVSVRRAAGIIGLGSDAVVASDCDRTGRIDPDALDRRLSRLAGDEIVVAVVATAGTTDLGTFDRLAALSEVTRSHRVWLHVDAAYGGAVMFSPRLSQLIEGIERTDSVALDLHKLGWAPASSAVFLVREGEWLSPLSADASYLGAPDDAAAGYTSPVGHSLQTTRRADALKIAVVLGVLGRSGMAALIEACHELASHAARRISTHPRLELAAQPVLSTVVFRCLPGDAAASEDAADTLNANVRRRLAESGEALIGRTTLSRPSGRPAVYLKLVLMTPTTTAAQLDSLLDRVVSIARAVEATVVADGA